MVDCGLAVKKTVRLSAAREVCGAERLKRASGISQVTDRL